MIKSGVKVYPFKTVEAGATVNTSIVWESRGLAASSAALGVTGLANVDISPELVDAPVDGLGDDPREGQHRSPPRATPRRAARVLKRAMIVGLQRGRASTWRTSRSATVPVTRFQVRSGRASAGITVRLFERRPAVGHDPLLRPGRHRHRRGRPAQDRAALPPRGVPAGPGVGDRRHRLPAACAGALHRRARSTPSTSTPSPGPGSRWCSTTPSGRPAS